MYYCSLYSTVSTICRVDTVVSPALVKIMPLRLAKPVINVNFIFVTTYYSLHHVTKLCNTIGRRQNKLPQNIENVEGGQDEKHSNRITVYFWNNRPIKQENVRSVLQACSSVDKNAYVREFLSVLCSFKVILILSHSLT